jgi:iron complex outermembrane receptor protein
MAGGFSLLMGQVAWADSVSEAEWLRSAGEAVEARADALVAQDAPVEITAIRVEETEAGAQLVVETAAGEVLNPTVSTMGNAVVVEIPNAVLALPDGEEFQAAAPAAGIAYISAMALADLTVRISITGTEAAPEAVIAPGTHGFVLNLSPGITSAEAADEAPLRVVVTATRTEEDPLDIPRSVTVVTREEIEEQATLSRDLQDILAFTVPGFGPPTGRAFSGGGNVLAGAKSAGAN